MFVFVPRRCERGLKVRQFGAKIRKKPQTLRAPGANIATRCAKYTQMGAFCNLERRDRAKIAKSQPGRRAGAWGGRCGACKASPTRREAAAEPAKPRRRAGKPLQNLQSPPTRGETLAQPQTARRAVRDGNRREDARQMADRRIAPHLAASDDRFVIKNRKNAANPCRIQKNSLSLRQ